MGSSSSKSPTKVENQTIKLYYMPMSSPCRAVMLTATSLCLKMDYEIVDIMKQEHLAPDFLKINPQHCIPTIDDGGFILWESRAICRYLVNKYGTDDTLYPRNPQKRALVDSRLDFDQGTLNKVFQDHYLGIFRGKMQTDETKKALGDALTLFDTLLASTKWAAGKEVTIADMSLAATVTTLEALGHNLKEYKRIKVWLLRCKQEIYNFKQINQDEVEKFAVIYNSFLEKKDASPGTLQDILHGDNSTQIKEDKFIHEETKHDKFIHEETKQDKFIHEETKQDKFIHEETKHDKFIHEETKQDKFIHKKTKEDEISVEKSNGHKLFDEPKLDKLSEDVIDAIIEVTEEITE